MLNCDTPAAFYDHPDWKLCLYMNPNVCPTFTDAVLPEVAKRYFASYVTGKSYEIQPYSMGWDTYFADPMIGIPSNAVYFENADEEKHAA